MENIPTVLIVVAAALIDVNGRVLMHRRRQESVHGGLWEFPGGKLESGEGPLEALQREIAEELGVALDIGGAAPVGFAADDAASTAHGGRRIVILLYTCRAWRGEVQCLEGEEIGWYPPGEIAALAMPPLDYLLADQLERVLRGAPN